MPDWTRSNRGPVFKADWRRSSNTAYNTRLEHVLDAKTPNEVVAERLDAEPKLANSAPHGRAGPCDATKERLIVDAAKEVSQPDN